MTGCQSSDITEGPSSTGEGDSGSRGTVVTHRTNSTNTCLITCIGKQNVNKSSYVIHLIINLHNIELRHMIADIDNSERVTDSPVATQAPPTNVRLPPVGLLRSTPYSQ